MDIVHTDKWVIIVVDWLNSYDFKKSSLNGILIGGDACYD